MGRNVDIILTNRPEEREQGAGNREQEGTAERMTPVARPLSNETYRSFAALRMTTICVVQTMSS